MARNAGILARALTLGSAGLAFAIIVGGDSAAAQPADAQTTGCVRCHASLDDDRLSAPVEGYLTDVHREQRFTCVECHGGDGTSDDREVAKSVEAGYVGAVTGMAQITMCARCHSDAEFMRRYVPAQRVDQATEYAVSVHGRLLADGRDDVATCASCHGVHGIRRVRDAQSPVYPLNIATTCASCHADPAHMGNEPTDQLAEYETSVHHTALTEGNDLSAPTCNDCHGNHGAAPPGVEDIVNVCSTCHAIFGTRFGASTHSVMFGCVECHGNHGVQPSRDEMLGTGEGAVCVECHGEGETGFEVAAQLRGRIDDLRTAIDAAETLTAEIHNDGMEVSDQELALAEARSRLTLARTEIHAADVDLVEPVIAEGLELVQGVEQAGQAQLAELSFRRVGLGISLFAILLVVVALWLKIQQLDRRHHVGHHEPETERLPPSD